MNENKYFSNPILRQKLKKAGVGQGLWWPEKGPQGLPKRTNSKKKSRKFCTHRILFCQDNGLVVLSYVVYVMRPPLLWTYLIRLYCRSLALCLFGIVLLLLSTKLEEIARFVALGASLSRICLFVVYQIPYTLQIALPLASLVAGYSVLASMSSSGELTALRSSGCSLASVLSPLAFFSFLLSIVVLWGVFDLSASSHLATKKLEFDVRKEEPLAVLQNSRFLAEHGVALELTGSLQTGESSKNVILCFSSPGSSRLSLMLFKEATPSQHHLHGSAMTALSSRAPENPDQLFGSLVVENATSMVTPTDFAHEITKKKKWKPTADHFPLSVVRAKQREIQQRLCVAVYKGTKTKRYQKLLSKYSSEPFRRLSLSLAIFTLCIAGATCGARTARGSRQLWQALGPFIAFSLFIFSYLAGKNLDEVAWLAIAFYVCPHPILWLFSKMLRSRLEVGMEY